jgi:hydrogenase expression/formation protein HypE
MAHGAGGKASRTLTESLFLDAFKSPALARLEDFARVDVARTRLAFTTDSFVVSPLFFPGGSIGDLAVNGTVNDLAVSGARPLAISAAFILEEGFSFDELRRVVSSMRDAAEGAGVEIVTGDTKVVPAGSGDGCYITTAGIGVIERDIELSPARIEPGDAILVSGPIGDHGVTILVARGELEIDSDIASDTAPITPLVEALLEGAGGVRCLRDATRGGVATIANEFADASGYDLVLDERAIPLRTEVRGACELLGLDPLYVACEGRFVAVVAAEEAEAALKAVRSVPGGGQAAVVGHVGDGSEGLVLLHTEFGGTRIVDMLIGDPMPRIC